MISTKSITIQHLCEKDVKDQEVVGGLVAEDVLHFDILVKSDT